MLLIEASLNFNFYNVLIFSGIVYGIVFSSSIFFHKSITSRVHLFIGLTIVSLTLSNLQYWLIDIGVMDAFNIPDLYNIQFELLIVPLFYLFKTIYI